MVGISQALYHPVMVSLALLAKLLVVLPGSGIGAGDEPSQFPDLTNADIPGAPKLGHPVLLMGETRPVMGQLHGLAAPAFHDWDGDGKRDLMIGEFETGECTVRVYRNLGTDVAPRFSDEFELATTTDEKLMKVDSW